MAIDSSSSQIRDSGGTYKENHRLSLSLPFWQSTPPPSSRRLGWNLQGRGQFVPTNSELTAPSLQYRLRSGAPLNPNRTESLIPICRYLPTDISNRPNVVRDTSQPLHQSLSSGTYPSFEAELLEEETLPVSAKRLSMTHLDSST